MARYMLLFEVDISKTPEDAKSKKAQYLEFVELIARQLKEGVIKEWSGFAGEANGYMVFEGSSVDLQTLVGMWAPFVKFKTREVMTIHDVIKAFKALPE